MRSKCNWLLSLCLFLAVMVLTSSVSLAADNYRILWGPNPVPGASGGGGGHPIEVSEGSTGGTSGDGSSVSSGSDSQLYGVIVYANTRYNAALITLGYDPDDSRFTDEVKIKLKVENFGGAFTRFAQSFATIEGDNGNFRLPTFYDNDTMNRQMLYGVCASATSLYGAENVWSHLYTKSEFGTAQLAVELLLSDSSGGGSGGGSGGTVPEGDVMEATVKCHQDLTWKGYNFSDGDTVKVSFPIDSTVRNFLEQPDYIYSIGFSPAGGSTSVSNAILTIWCYVPEWEFTKFVNTNGNVGWMTAEKSNGLHYYGDIHVTVTSWYYDTSSSTIVVGSYYNTWQSYYGNTSNSVFVGLGKQSYYFPSTYWTSWNTSVSVGAFIPFIAFDFMGEDAPVTDPDPDPEPEPVTPRPDLPTPDPPVVPDPPDDPVVPDPPVLPDPKNPIIPSTPTPDVDTGTYTPDLSGILDAMTQHCQHLQAKMIECSEYQAQYFEYVFDGFQDDLFSYLQGAVDYIVGALGGITTEGDYTQVGNWISWLGESIHLDFGYLLDYLEALWTWLKDSLVIDFTGVGAAYDDGSLIGWLEKIYLKLGEGFNFTPKDPVTNPGDTSSWLDQFLGSFFGSLLGNLAGVLADAAGSLATLATKFPFCIPWDIMAILGLLASPPVCPVITLPCYSLTSSGLQEVGTYVIDLHDIEFAVEGIRWMFKLGFILVLANRTKDWLEMLEGVMG